MKKTTILASAVMLALLSGCGGKDAAEHYQDAQTYITQNKFNAAVIELKSAIQQMPEQAQYRQTLGLLYLQMSDPVSASKELSRAISLGAKAEPIAVPLMQALYLSEDYQAVLAGLGDEVALSDQTQNYVKLYQALAEIELSNIDAAVPVFDELILSDQLDVKSFSEAALSVRAKSYDNAQIKLAQVSVDSPIYYQAVLMQAHVAILQQQYDAALEQVNRYISYMPTALKVRLLAAQLLVQQGKFEDADGHVSMLLKAVPEHGLTNYLKAVIEYQEKSYQTAKEHIDKAIQAKLNTVQARVLAGLTHYQLGLETQALVHLSAVKQYLPGLPDINRLYTALQLKAGEISEAAKSIGAADLTAKDMALISATTLELIRKGDDSGAAELLARYEQLVVSDDVESLQTLGQLKLNIVGQELAGIDALEQALALDPSQHQTRLTLAGSYIRLKQYDRAEQLAEEWINNEDTAATGYNLKALLALIQNKTAKGKELLDLAYSKDSSNVFTHLMMATVATSEGNKTLADELLLKAISVKRDYIPALSSYFISQSKQGKPETAIELIEKSSIEFPQNIQLKVFLANVYMLNQRYQDAISIISPLIEQNQQVHDAIYWLLARGYSSLNQVETGLKLTERWFNQSPNSLAASFAHANFLASAKRYDEAIKLLDAALKQQPKNAILLKTKIHAQAEMKDYKGALSTIELLPIAQKEDAEMLFHKGRLQLLDNQLSPGLVTLHQSYNLNPLTKTAIGIAEATARDISYRKAVTFLEQHIAKHGDNKALRVFYANLLIQDDIAKAETIYAKLVEEEPGNFISLNNYAWVLQQAGNPDKALTYIEKAMAINAENPDVLDSYGKILLALKQYDKAKLQFEKSLKIRPANAEVQLNYAELLIETSGYEQARNILSAINSNDPALISRKTTLLTSLP